MTDPKNAGYGVNSYLKAQLSLAGFDMPFYPGLFAPENAPDSFVMFRQTPNTPADLWMVHNDTAKYCFYHTSYDSLQTILNTTSSLFNVEDIEATTLSEPHIRYQYTHVVVGDIAEAIYIEGNNYYTADANLVLVYTIIG